MAICFPTLIESFRIFCMRGVKYPVKRNFSLTKQEMCVIGHKGKRAQRTASAVQFIIETPQVTDAIIGRKKQWLTTLAASINMIPMARYKQSQRTTHILLLSSARQ
ncbi:MAG: hypothetical protein A3G34_05175 [Candidatus Lindowbacteria bacterium RIFCSPLOWO2_12_FULL_62_27]|nr:MAG: hypothetical protein A3G34_05175 [Candidatus Lindowbacteria bacterium RIFCSPLOWO2_12_FULL_62_27]OGH62005.1 MAG: hypothetical protein A3I06_04570 [Candidatus Lindowbacteria bacterium RIFCSPLOWO2_02_FULL_62_12]